MYMLIDSGCTKEVGRPTGFNLMVAHISS